MMQESTIIMMMNESRRIVRGMLFWVAVLASSVMGLIFLPYYSLRATWLPFLYIVLITAVVVSISALMINSSRVISMHNRVNASKPAPRRQPTDRSASLLFTERKIRPAAIVPDTTQNTILVRDYPFTPQQWHRLVTELAMIRYRWNKKALAKSKIFTVRALGKNVLADGVYPDVCADFEALDFIEGGMGHWKLTSLGRESLRQLAKLDVLP